MSARPTRTIGRLATEPSSARHAWIREPVDETESLCGAPLLTAQFTDARAFLRAYRDDEAAGSISVATRAQPHGSGVDIVLEVFWPGLPNHVYLRARAYRRPHGILARLHPDSTRARDFLLRQSGAGRDNVHHRRHRRYAVHVPLLWRSFGSTDSVGGVAEDLSTGGMLIATGSQPPPRGERVTVRLRPSEKAQDLVLTGIVRHAEARSNDRAFGVEFECRSSGEQRRLRRLVRTFAARGLVLLQR